MQLHMLSNYSPASLILRAKFLSYFHSHMIIIWRTFPSNHIPLSFRNGCTSEITKDLGVPGSPQPTESETLRLELIRIFSSFLNFGTYFSSLQGIHLLSDYHSHLIGRQSPWTRTYGTFSVFLLSLFLQLWKWRLRTLNALSKSR